MREILTRGLEALGVDLDRLPPPRRSSCSRRSVTC